MTPTFDELLNMIPTRSIVAQEAAANAILSGFVAKRNVDADAFGRNHPGGSIGKSIRGPTKPGDLHN